ncbi:glycosyltransferase family 2 protein [Clostridium perfringens]
MKSDILFTIIIPVYNAFETLRDTVNSIRNQTYSNYELILVDDGSEKKTSILCDSLTDEKVQCFHINNHGVSYARNYGLERASGDYIIFVDSDDIISINLLSDLYNEIKCYKSDIIIFGYDVCDKNLKVNNFVCNRDIIRINTNKCFENNKVNFLFNNRLIIPVWNKAFRRKCINNIFFNTDLSIYEDTLFVVEAFCNSNIFSVLDKSYYKYIVDSKPSLSKKLNLNGIYGLSKIYEVFLRNDYYSIFQENTPISDYLFEEVNNQLSIIYQKSILGKEKTISIVNNILSNNEIREFIKNLKVKKIKKKLKKIIIIKYPNYLYYIFKCLKI